MIVEPASRSQHGEEGEHVGHQPVDLSVFQGRAGERGTAGDDVMGVSLKVRGGPDPVDEEGCDDARRRKRDA